MAIPADSRREKIFDFVREFAVKYFRIVTVRDFLTSRTMHKHFRGSFGSFFEPIFVLKLKLFVAISFCRQAALAILPAILGKDQKGLHKRGIHDQGDFWQCPLEATV